MIKKALLIGVNYLHTDSLLHGCFNDVKNLKAFLITQGYSPDNMVSLMDDQKDPKYKPSRAQMLLSFQWLVSNNCPGDSLFLLYSGHGGNDDATANSDRLEGQDDTICPYDYEENGTISSEELHRALVSPLLPGVKLTVLFDCCHSGSALELPYMYKADSSGQVTIQDSLKKGAKLLSSARNLVKGGNLINAFTPDKIHDAKMLIAGASSLFSSFSHKDDPHKAGLTHDYNFANDTFERNKDVWMLSGCQDDSTSADATIDGKASGALAWGFVKSLTANHSQTYLQLLQSIRGLIVEEYGQTPQLSCGDANKDHLNNFVVI